MSDPSQVFFWRMLRRKLFWCVLVDADDYTLNGGSTSNSVIFNGEQNYGALKNEAMPQGTGKGYRLVPLVRNARAPSFADYVLTISGCFASTCGMRIVHTTVPFNMFVL